MKNGDERKYGRMEKFFWVFLWIVFSFPARTDAAETSLPAERIKPEIVVKTDEGTPSYLYKNKKVPCSGAGHVLGCTRAQFYAEIAGSEITPAGALKKLVLSVGLKDVNIELSSELKKGTCLFDVVLKHELTHLALHRQVLKRFAAEMAKAVLSEAERQQPPLTRRKFDRLAKVMQSYLNRMTEEDDRQNALMDTGDAYLYQQSQCFNK